jgi:hypothetical protein
MKYPKDFRSAELRDPNANGDLEPFAYIAGGFIGAYFGAPAIPGVWAQCIEKSIFLDELSICWK